MKLDFFAPSDEDAAPALGVADGFCWSGLLAIRRRNCSLFMVMVWCQWPSLHGQAALLGEVYFQENECRTMSSKFTVASSPR